MIIIFFAFPITILLIINKNVLMIVYIWFIKCFIFFQNIIKCLIIVINNSYFKIIWNLKFLDNLFFKIFDFFIFINRNCLNFILIMNIQFKFIVIIFLSLFFIFKFIVAAACWWRRVTVSRKHLCFTLPIFLSLFFISEFDAAWWWRWFVLFSIFKFITAIRIITVFIIVTNHFNKMAIL